MYTHVRQQTHAGMHEHTHELARIHTRVCVRVTHARTHARMHARTHALTHRTRTQVRAHHTHANHGLALPHSGFPRCHDCRSPEVSSEPGNPRKRDRRQGNGSQTLNGYRLRLTLARSDHKGNWPIYASAGATSRYIQPGFLHTAQRASTPTRTGLATT